MARLTHQQQIEAINTAIDAGGGEIEHTALLEQLDYPTQQNVHNLVQRGEVARRVVSTEDGIKLLYTRTS